MIKVSKVSLRKSPISKDRKQSYYLDFYPPIQHPVSGQPTRRYSLNLVLFTRTTGQDEKKTNEAVTIQARSEAARVTGMVVKGDYSFLGSSTGQEDLIANVRKG
jgi:hypothetical protein